MMQASKGSARRPESPRDVLTCERGHWWIGQRCFRCKAARPAEEPTREEERT
jgi:hypothetical protein